MLHVHKYSFFFFNAKITASQILSSECLIIFAVSLKLIEIRFCKKDILGHYNDFLPPPGVKIE